LLDSRSQILTRAKNECDAHPSDIEDRGSNGARHLALEMPDGTKSLDEAASHRFVLARGRQTQNEDDR